MTRIIAAALATGALVSAAPMDFGSILYWPAEDLTAGRSTNLPAVTHTHAYQLVRLTSPSKAELHEGTSDIFFVVSGNGVIVAGGDLDGAAPLPGMPGELRGSAVKGGRRYELKAGAVINIPPSTPYMFEAAPAGLTAMQLRVNVGMHPWSIVSTQHAILPVTPDRPRLVVPLNSDQGTVWFWSAEQLKDAHDKMSAAAAAGRPVADPRDVVHLPATRTHAYNFLHRELGANGQPPAVEFHEGNTDIYFMLGGTGTLMTAGEIENKRWLPDRPGETQGTSIRSGKGYRVKAGDVINMPPSTPHQSIPDKGGFTYMLVKVNTGMYPWALTGIQPRP